MTTPSESPTRGADLVVVANRLPVRGVEQDGERVWATEPGRLGLRPGARAPRRATASGSAGPGSMRATAGRRPATRGHRAPRGADQRGRVRRVLPGFANATLWPLYHDAIRPADLRSVVVARVRRRERALRRRRGGGGRGAGSHGVGARLPAAARARDAARATARRADRVLPAHPVPAPGAVPAASVAAGDPRGPARRRPGRVPGAGRRRRTSPASRASSPARDGHGAHGRTSRAATCASARSRSPSTPPRSMAARGRSRRAGPGTRRSAPSSAIRELVLLGVDRLDYTKGIDRRLRAVR